MSSTPLFDSIARRTEGTASAQSDSAPVTTGGPSLPTTARASFTPAPTSPISAPVRSRDSMLVPAALVAAIDEIPARVVAAADAGHAVRAEQLVLVEAVADAITRAVVDAVVAELEQITRDGVVRA
ncbi:hypothetical protein EDF64_101523 [Curtobacterium flaccumfaciens]|uniref:Uncharacterized protein n=1 Tax=Curtobacterium flaccumfaciens TaxID=2035 RepID=A0A4R6DNT4_9MICO|nr:hypothetical protein [Curtobacterium flaccumfaciens]TDN46656.1 hypothetical protein EDF64_101523 [Curtobacterium flaccumfaciens]